MLDASLVRENQAFQEQQEYKHKKPFIDETVDFVDLGPGPAQNIDQSAFKPPMPANHFQTYDQNQTMKLQADETIAMQSGKPMFETQGTQKIHGGAIDRSANETLHGIFATLKQEANDMSDTGGNDQNPEWLFDKKLGQQVPGDQIGGPGGTGSSSSY